MIHHVIMVKKFKDIFYGAYWVNNRIIKKNVLAPNSKGQQALPLNKIKYDCFEINDLKLMAWSYYCVDECDLGVNYLTVIWANSKPVYLGKSYPII